MLHMAQFIKYIPSKHFASKNCIIILIAILNFCVEYAYVR